MKLRILFFLAILIPAGYTASLLLGPLMPRLEYLDALEFQIEGALPFGTLALDGGNIWTYGVLRFGGIGLLPAALATSPMMAAEHLPTLAPRTRSPFALVFYRPVTCLVLRRTGDLWMPLTRPAFTAPPRLPRRRVLRPAGPRSYCWETSASVTSARQGCAQPLPGDVGGRTMLSVHLVIQLLHS